MYGENYLGNILLSKGLITEKQLKEVVEIQTKTGKNIGRIFIDSGYVKEQDVIEALGIQNNIEAVKIKDINISQEIISLITPATAKKYKMIPVEKIDNTIVMAFSDKRCLNLVEEIRFMTGMELKLKVALEDEIQWALEKYYGIKNEHVEAAEDKALYEILENDVNLEELANEAPIVKLLNYILSQAIKDRASDIHFEPFEDTFKVRYRIDGVLYEMNALPAKLSVAIASRIKVMAGLDIAERRLPQDGRIDFNVGEKVVDLRVSTLPTIFGENIVMRVLDRSNIALSLQEIGLFKEDEEKIRKIMHLSHGIVLATGPTGSGKTTTLYAMLKELNSIESKIITAEDPVEYDIDGIIQVTTRPKIGLDFVKCLRHILRQDPDIIMVGEIRDVETAEMSIQSSLTGHLVLSTLHTNDAVSAVTRLLDMGIEPFLITSTLNAVIAQRLVRTICKNCKEPAKISEKILKEFHLTQQDIKDKVLYTGRGCEICNNTGYKGRIGIFEILIVDEEIKQLIAAKASNSVIRSHAQKNGMKLLREDALIKVFSGLTSLDEVLKETKI